MVTFFRAAVMLGTLVAVPAAWWHYGPLPEGAQARIEQYLEQGKQLLGWQEAPKPNPQHFGPQHLGPEHINPEHLGPKLAVTGRERSAPALPPAPYFGNTNTDHTKTSDTNATAGSSPANGGGLSVELEPLLEQLRQLGATQYDLQTWGSQGRLYRFQCDMPVAGVAYFSQQFDAVAAQPQQAISQVLAEVRERGGSSAGTSSTVAATSAQDYRR